MKRRWKTDGGDYMTGRQEYPVVAPGAFLSWHIDGKFSVWVWTAKKECEFKRHYPLAEAKRRAEAWLEKYGA
jgi:hypothetical protein